MRCVMCGKEFGEGSLRDILFGEDPLCLCCRSQWLHQPQRYRVNGVQGESDYLYNEAFSSCLIQFKECGDEALKDIFLFETKRRIARKYRGWTLCLMPSSQEKQERRGFSHLQEIFASTGLKILDPFVKTEDIVQKKRSYTERQQMKAKIRLKEGISLPDRILLCDDVITTGATLKGALCCIEKEKYLVRIYTIAADTQEKMVKKGMEWE